VFLKHNGFPKRFFITRHNDTTPLKPIKIAETGFGTGLNFLTTIHHWNEIDSDKHLLEYISVEKFPLEKLQLERIYHTFGQQWPQLNPYCRLLLERYPDEFSQSQITIELPLNTACVKLTLLFNDAALGFDSIISEQSRFVDAWYLDGFAPAKNPDMWSPALFQKIQQLSHSGTTFSTFTAAGFVRRGLLDSGFNVYKDKGYGKKREMLYGEMK
jgi:tRNA 5-methylaminomethyl-2-thiouridine biosynthesis bifunctional protein